jgi:hypothetical protein
MVAAAGLSWMRQLSAIASTTAGDGRFEEWSFLDLQQEEWINEKMVNIVRGSRDDDDVVT